MSDSKEKIVLEWHPKWPSVKNLGGALKDFVDGEYADWRGAQGEDFGAPVHVVAHVQDWPYVFVVDFLQRLPTLLKLTGFASIEVRRPPTPSELTDEQWHGETLRVLRALNGPETWICQNGDSVLSKQCIITVVEELHKRAFKDPALTEETALQVLANHYLIKREGSEPYKSNDRPAIKDGTVELDGDFNAEQLRALLFFLEGGDDSAKHVQ